MCPERRSAGTLLFRTRNPGLRKIRTGPYRLNPFTPLLGGEAAKGIMKCWITLTSHSGTVNDGKTWRSNEGRLLMAEIERERVMSFRSMNP